MPGCEAVMLQVPAPINVAMEPETVQTAGVVEAKLTARFEVALAVSVRGVPTVWAAIALNVIVCV